MRTRGICLLFLVSLALIIWGCTAPVKHLATPTAPERPQVIETGGNPQPALLEKRLIVLEWPQTIREKDSDLIVLSIPLDKATPTPTPEIGSTQGGTPIDIPDLYKTHNIVAVARLDLAGMEAYREDIREPLSPGQEVTFRWSIRANEPGVYRGVVWLRLELVPKKGGPVDERLLMARPIEIRAVSVLGMSAELARWLGGLGLALSTAMGYPFIQHWIEQLLKRRKAKGKPASPAAPEAHDSSEAHASPEAQTPGEEKPGEGGEDKLEKR